MFYILCVEQKGNSLNASFTFFYLSCRALYVEMLNSFIIRKGLQSQLYTARKNDGFDQIENFADDRFIVTKIMNPVNDMVENLVGKGEHSGNQHFLFFSHEVLKGFLFQCGKTQDCVRVKK